LPSSATLASSCDHKSARYYTKLFKNLTTRPSSSSVIARLRASGWPSCRSGAR
jgi:hypothetical protein